MSLSYIDHVQVREWARQSRNRTVRNVIGTMAEARNEVLGDPLAGDQVDPAAAQAVGDLIDVTISKLIALYGDFSEGA